MSSHGWINRRRSLSGPPPLPSSRSDWGWLSGIARRTQRQPEQIPRVEVHPGQHRLALAEHLVERPGLDPAERNLRTAPRVPRPGRRRETASVDRGVRDAACGRSHRQGTEFRLRCRGSNRYPDRRPQKNRTLHRISGRHDLRNRTRPASRHRNPQCPPLRADSGVNHQPLGLNVAGSDVCVGPLLPLVPVKSLLTHATWIDGQTGQRVPVPRAPPQSGQPG